MITRHQSETRAGLAELLASAVATDLANGLASRGRASLAVSGGSTPALFFQALATKTLDWANVIITLVDERWVDGASTRSNAKLVQEKLLQGQASAAQFIPLYSGGELPDAEAIARSAAALADLPHPFDAVVLGMGNDGHTASFFPGGDRLDEALTEAGPLVAMRAQGAGEPRVTLTLPYLLATNGLYLHIEGAEKSATLEKALQPGNVAEMPVRAVLLQDKKPVNIFWCL